MSQQATIRDVQRRTIQLINYEDGLLDLLLGMMFMMLAVYPVTRKLLGPAWNTALFLAILGLLAGGQTVARRFISGPRMGYAKLRRSPQLRIALTATATLVAITFGLLILTLVNPEWLPNLRWAGGPEWLRLFVVDIAVLLVTIGLFSGFGYLFGVGRLYLYGWLIGIGNLASVMMHHYAGTTFNFPLAVAAAIIIFIGLWLLMRFIRRYPVQTQEA